MKIHEYQAKAILARYGVTTPRGEVAFTKEEAREAAQRLKSQICVVKAQIHARGRDGNRGSRQGKPRRHFARDDSSVRRFAALSGPQDCFWPEFADRSYDPGHALPPGPVSCLPRYGCLAARN